MAEKDEKVVMTGEKTIESNTESPIDKVEVEKEVAVKPTEEEAKTDAPTEEDVDDLLSVLNEIIAAGELGENINAVPDEVRPIAQYLIDKITFLRSAYQDPLFSDILDDMAEQAELGETPSVEVAIARTIPFEDIEKAADEENYSEIQSKIVGNVSRKARAVEEENRVLTNIEQTMQNLEDYGTEQGYSDEEKEALMAEVKKMMGWFADGSISIEEFAEIDKKRNYDRDINDLKSQITTETKKEVMPDAASMKTMAAPPKKERKPGLMDGVATINEPSYLKKKK